MYRSEVGSVSVQYNPTWRYGGNQLKRWRMKANVTREELGAASNYAPDTIKAMEQGVRMPTARVLDVADELCGAGGLLSAAKEYVKAEKFPAQAQDFMEYERDAISRWSFEVALVPGLLQTQTYARALIGNHCPPLDAETVEERITARMERQELLVRTPPVALSFVLYEAALRAPQADNEQLLRLLDAGRLTNVSIQVLPFSRVIPAALMGSMVLLETRDRERLAFTEGPSSSELTSAPEVVSLHTERLSMIRMEAMGTEESALFIKGMTEAL
ncbi:MULTISPECIES: helix-turn-helix transcriptional regulator [unclassified Streptomyces]|uniref:helix-turn-helix domain-containing protein n=1 Tax=unclassified Streptomyces TaxID=2593676 RepID=UPI0033E6CBE6